MSTPSRPRADEVTASRIAAAPLPTPATLRKRQNVALQLVRFAAINLRMIGVIRRGHG